MSPVRRVAGLSGITAVVAAGGPDPAVLCVVPDRRLLYPDRFHIRPYEAAGIRHVTNHGLRHTHASLMLRRGEPLEVVSQKLGHARASFTTDVYRHVYEHEAWALDLSDLVE